MNKIIRPIFLITCFLSIACYAAAQPTSIDDSIMSIKGKWSTRPAFLPTPGPAKPEKLFPVLQKKVDSIARLFRQAYPDLKGTDGYWYASLEEGTLFKDGPWSYAYRSAFLYYYYNTAYKKIVKVTETVTWAYAFINRVSWLFEEIKMNIDADGKPVSMWKFPVEKGEWNGYTLYEPLAHGPEARAIVITKEGRLPWKPVTRLQYLQALRQKHEEEKQATNARVDKSAAAAEKQIEAIKNNASFDQATKDKMIALLRSTLDKQVPKTDADKQKFNAFWDKEIKVIDDYINSNNEATLSQQAIVSNWRIFTGSFAPVTDKYATKLVYIDPAYFNNDLPSYAPQFIVLYWRWNKNAPGHYFRKQMEENFPVEKLKAFIRN
ncbi:MAG: hypothetical protein WCF67_17555 [Chitinophagaceae bacterium]